MPQVHHRVMTRVYAPLASDPTAPPVLCFVCRRSYAWHDVSRRSASWTTDAGRTTQTTPPADFSRPGAGIVRRRPVPAAKISPFVRALAAADARITARCQQPLNPTTLAAGAIRSAFRAAQPTFVSEQRA